MKRDPKGKSVCFTGKLAAFTRNQARVMALNAGMEIFDTVTHGLDYLVAADLNSMSSKARKAKAYGTELISESDFLEMVGLDGNTAKTEADRMNAPKKVLDWKSCFDAISKKLGITSTKKSEPVYWRGKDEKLTTVRMWFGNNRYYLGSSAELFRRRDYCGRRLEWTDNDRYDLNDDDAYRKAVWMIGTKTFGPRPASFDWCMGDRENSFETALGRFLNSYPEFGMPSSTAELKLKLEALGWSIL